MGKEVLEVEPDAPTQLGPTLDRLPVLSPPPSRAHRQREGNVIPLSSSERLYQFLVKAEDGLAAGCTKGLKLQTGE